jgi:hypothetical protein
MLSRPHSARRPRLSLHSRGRYDNLHEIRGLDPVRDPNRIVWLTSRREFPWDYTQGTGIAFLRDYGVPSIARLLDRTREFEDDGVKRYDDTLLFAEEATVEVQALANFTTRFGTMMGIKDLPTTYDGYLELLTAYEREHFAFDPANRRVTEATLRVARRAAYHHRPSSYPQGYTLGDLGPASMLDQLNAHTRGPVTG